MTLKTLCSIISREKSFW
jgi:hypothetical protein